MSPTLIVGEVGTPQSTGGAVVHLEVGVCHALTAVIYVEGTELDGGLGVEVISSYHKGPLWNGVIRGFS